MKDFNGVEFQVGDRIVYAGRKASDLWLTSGVITEIHEEPGTIRVLPSYTDKPVTLKNLFTVAVLGR